MLDEYRSELESAREGGTGAPGVDELVVGGLPRAASAALAESIEKLGDTGLRLAHAEARRYVRDDGITYGSTEILTPSAFLRTLAALGAKSSS